MEVYWCLVRNPFSWLALLSSLFAYSHSPGFGFLTIFLTSSALILWRYELKLARRKASPSLSTQEFFFESSLEEKVSSLNKPLEEEQVSEALISVPTQIPTEIGDEVTQLKKQEQEEKTICDYLLKSSEALLSDSESQDQTITSDDYSENDSIFSKNLSHSTNYSDGSISDEESLIEIALPTGHYVDPKRSQEQSWYGFQQKWPDCSLESHFRQQNWMDMLSEMNEENFIEFDICMGSIKCSRFEIQA